MKLKLDENLGAAAGAVFRKEGFDAATVGEQAMCGTADAQLARHCARERRCLVTLDVEFANPFLFPPWEYAGIAVLRPPPRLSHGHVLDACATLAEALKRSDVSGKTWIVEIGRIREYRPDRSPGDE